MSTFKNARILCGLSRASAANFLGVSPETVKKWDQGKTHPPRGVWEMLAERMVTGLKHGAPRGYGGSPLRLGVVVHTSPRLKKRGP